MNYLFKFILSIALVVTIDRISFLPLTYKEFSVTINQVP